MLRLHQNAEPLTSAPHRGDETGTPRTPPGVPPPPGLEAAIARVPGRPGDLVAERGDRYAPQPEGSVWTYPPTRSFERKQDGANETRLVGRLKKIRKFRG